MNCIVSMSIICLVGCAGVAVGQACKPLGSAAAEGGLNILGQAVAMAAQSLEATDDGMAVLGAVTASVAVPEDMRVTFFAPSDVAFQAALQALSSQNGETVTPGPEELAAVLLNHVVAGDFTATAIEALLGEAGGSTIVPTLLGSDLVVSTVDEGLYVQSLGLDAPGALVVTPDILTCVGPVHVINSVLLPADADDMIAIFSDEPGTEEACTPLGATAEAAGLTTLADAIRTEVERLKMKPSGTAFLAAVSQMEDVMGDNRVTVFAPTNEAFTSAAQKFGGNLPESDVADVLLNHVVPGEFTAAAIRELLGTSGGSVVVKTLLQSDVYVTATDSGLRIQSRGLEAPGALVVTEDVNTCVGPVHVVDQVLLPADAAGATISFVNEPAVPPKMESEAAGPEAAGPKGVAEMVVAGIPQFAVNSLSDYNNVSWDEVCSPVGTTASGAGLTALVDTINAEAERLKTKPAGSAFLAAVSNMEKVTGTDRVTIFAPTNDAFTAAAQKFGGELPESAIADVLLNHVVPGDLTASAITDMLGTAGGSVVVKTLLESDVYVSTTDSGLTIQSRGLEAPGALVVTADVMTCAGPVHVIDTVLLAALPDGSGTTKFATESGGEEQQEDPGMDPENGEGAEGTAAPITQPDTSTGAHLIICVVGTGALIAAVALTM